MQDEEWWEQCQSPGEMLATRGVRSARKRRLFAVACCYRIWDRLTDERCRRAVKATEEMADREGMGEEWEHWNEIQAVLEELDRSRNSENPLLEALSAEYRWAVEAVSETVHPNMLGVAEKVSSNTRALHLGSWHEEQRAQCQFLREIFGNPFRPVIMRPAWRTTDVMLLTRGIYEDRAFDRMPILADALQDAGCANDDLLNHLRDTSLTHIRGCWAIDLVLGKG